MFQITSQILIDSLSHPIAVVFGIVFACYLVPFFMDSHGFYQVESDLELVRYSKILRRRAKAAGVSTDILLSHNAVRHEYRRGDGTSNI